MLISVERLPPSASVVPCTSLSELVERLDLRVDLHRSLGSDGRVFKCLWFIPKSSRGDGNIVGSGYGDIEEVVACATSAIREKGFKLGMKAYIAPQLVSYQEFLDELLAKVRECDSVA